MPEVLARFTGGLVAPASLGSLSHQSSWNPTPAAGGGTFAQLKQLSIEHNTQHTNEAILTSGTIRVTGGFLVPAGMPVTNVAFLSGATALGTGVNQWAGICGLNRLVLGVSADRTTEAWAAYTLKQFPLGAVWAPAVDTPVYLFLMVGAAVVPTATGVAYTSSSMMGSPTLGGNGAAAQTAPPVNGSTLAAFSVGSTLVQCGWS